MSNDTATAGPTWTGDPVPTLARAGTTIGPQVRVGVMPDQPVAVLRAFATDTGLDLAGLDELIARLTEARAVLASTTDDGWRPPADAARSKLGDLIHVCNGDNRSGLPFGKLAPEGQCPRCDERRHGAAPRERGNGMRYGRRAAADAERSADIRAHFASVGHQRGDCGIVCTYGDW